MDNNFKYEYIIDCGTSSRRTYIKQAVKEYSKETKYVDLLVISHLHDDHFSGIKYFKENKIKLDTCVLPYISEIERIHLYVKYLNANKYCSDYKELFINPGIYLTENINVDNVVYLYSRSLLDNIKTKFYHSNEYDLNNVNIKKHIILNKDIIQGDKDNVNNKVSIFTKLNINLNTCIEFDFFNISIEDEKLEEFKNVIIDKVNNKTLNEFIKENKNDIRDIIYNYDNNYVKVLQNAYRLLDNKINNTSLCVSITSKCINRNKIGYMFTGDISFKTREIYERFIKYYSGKLKNINIFTLPHHNWNNNILNQLEEECILVVSSDPNNKRYNHPSKSVIYDITYEDRSIEYFDLVKYFCNKHYCK